MIKLDSQDDLLQATKNIGLYMKSGYCYCDIKSFAPEVVCMALVALWFSDHKTKKANSKYYNTPNIPKP
jgi:hypothetical protein